MAHKAILIFDDSVEFFLGDLLRLTEEAAAGTDAGIGLQEPQNLIQRSGILFESRDRRASVHLLKLFVLNILIVDIHDAERLQGFQNLFSVGSGRAKAEFLHLY